MCLHELDEKTGGEEGEKRGKHARNVQVATKTRVTKARIGADKDENITQEHVPISRWKVQGSEDGGNGLMQITVIMQIIIEENRSLISLMVL